MAFVIIVLECFIFHSSLIYVFVGFKSEWATIKDEQLYVGSMGKEWTTPSGEFEHNNPLWVKVVSPRGETHSLNWISYYKRLRQAINIEYPGMLANSTVIIF